MYIFIYNWVKKSKSGNQNKELPTKVQNLLGAVV